MIGRRDSKHFFVSNFMSNSWKQQDHVNRVFCLSILLGKEILDGRDRYILQEKDNMESLFQKGKMIIGRAILENLTINWCLHHRLASFPTWVRHVEKESPKAKSPSMNYCTSFFPFNRGRLPSYIFGMCPEHCIAQKACDDKQKFRMGMYKCTGAHPRAVRDGMVHSPLPLEFCKLLSPSKNAYIQDDGGQFLEFTWKLDNLLEQETNLLLQIREKSTFCPEGVRGVGEAVGNNRLKIMEWD
ncbi:hypothetical protein Tco_1545935 [Tanacetum coccineum]